MDQQVGCRKHEVGVCATVRCPETCVRGVCQLPGTPQGSELGGMLWGVRWAGRQGE